MIAMILLLYLVIIYITYRLTKNSFFLQGIKYLFGWIVLFILMISIYTFKNELYYFIHRMILSINPSYQWNENDMITINRSKDSHFYINTNINGIKIKFLIDTGASDITLNQQDALKLGIDITKLQYTKIYSTANGLVKAAIIELNNMTIGNITFKNINAHISAGDLDTSLLGMSILEKFKNLKIDNDILILTYPN